MLVFHSIKRTTRHEVSYYVENWYVLEIKPGTYLKSVKQTTDRYPVQEKTRHGGSRVPRFCLRIFGSHEFSSPRRAYE